MSDIKCLMDFADSYSYSRAFINDLIKSFDNEKQFDLTMLHAARHGIEKLDIINSICFIELIVEHRKSLVNIFNTSTMDIYNLLCSLPFLSSCKCYLSPDDAKELFLNPNSKNPQYHYFYKSLAYYVINHVSYNYFRWVW